MSSKAQNAKNEASRKRSLRSATNLQKFDSGQQLNTDKVEQNLPGLFGKGLKLADNNLLLTESVDQYQLLVAMEAGDQDALNQISLGGSRRLVNSQSSFACELVGGIPYGFTMPAPPNVGDSWAAAEMCETYEMCMAADIPFSTLNSNTPNDLADRAVATFAGFGANYKGPKESNAPTRHLLFRGTAFGCDFGPYVSQFLMHDFNLGVNPITQKHLFETGTYCNTEVVMEEILKGNVPQTQTFDSTPKRPYTPRGLGSIVHVDFVYQFFYYAAQIILNAGIPRNGAYTDIYPDEAFVTNAGVVHIATAVADVCKHAMTAAWLQKWRNHVRLRPEEMACRVMKQRAGQISGVVSSDMFSLGANTVDAVKTYNLANGGDDAEFLPQIYCEGSPTHPAYPSGHATVAGACITVLKMIFNNSPWTDMGDFASVYESLNGNDLTLYGGDTSQMTVHTELNKLGANCAHGRMAAGVHYRSDGDEGMNLGEKVAIAYYEDYLARQIEPYGTISFVKFDGTTHVVASGGGNTRLVGERAKFQRDI